MGWIESYRRPGGNITGIYNVNSALAAKRLEMLKELLPATSRVAVLFDPAFGKRHIDALRPTARTLGMVLDPIPLRDRNDFGAGFKAAKARKVQAVLLMWSPMFYVHRVHIAELALQAGLPTVSELDTLTAAGCLLSYGSDGYYPFERAAYFVDRLLKGARASDLPVEQLSKLKLAVNLKTAKALGIAIPQSILLRADEQIE
jgi:putative ABC transport system substrate-binding protein